ncbi:hypothetical protein BCR44DRAFT_1312340 [Catenaria anguillulae PL171]|uniref:Uncharacterized protein n=1 Tax=Catenaria anguillulae PL171 TaxID=765915 RepID=A0A1Y2H901_9FUNG|nr:hypothetical protein BCR44DRAFT_1312340 [Catenaria anguillulae PL171]
MLPRRHLPSTLIVARTPVQLTAAPRNDTPITCHHRYIGLKLSNCTRATAPLDQPLLHHHYRHRNHVCCAHPRRSTPNEPRFALHRL